MKALTCEMCGSHDMIKKDGFYVCESCGTKYTTEEAKKLLVEATVVIDESNRVSNYLELARQALAAGNKENAEGYANRALEVDAENYEAWLIKAKAVGGQFGLESSRLRECVPYYVKAYQLTDSDEVKEDVVSSLQDICVDMIALGASSYERSGNPGEAEALLRLGGSIERQCTTFETETGATVLTTSVRKKIASTVSQSAARAWNNVIAPEFRQTGANVQVFYNKGMGAINLLKFAIRIDEDADSRNLTRYENMCDMADSLMSPVIPHQLKREVSIERNTWKSEISRLSKKTDTKSRAVRDSSKQPLPERSTYDKMTSGPRAIILIIVIVIIVVLVTPFFLSCGR